jgi:CspA family cold shock protein
MQIKPCLYQSNYCCINRQLNRSVIISNDFGRSSMNTILRQSQEFQASKHAPLNKTQGTVKWFSDTKGFGFLVADNDPSDVFVHYSAIVSDSFKTIREGQRVAFDLMSGPKGPQALNVEVL